MSRAASDSPSPSSLRLLPVGALLFLVATALVAAPLAAFGAWLGARRSDEEERRFDFEARQHALSVEETVREYTSLKREVLEVTAGTLSALRDWDLGQVQGILDAQLRSTRSFDSLHLGDMRGTSLVFAPSRREDGVVTRAGVSYADRDYFQDLLRTREVSFGNVRIGKQSGVANIHVAVPVYADVEARGAGALRGYVAAGIRPDLIEQTIKRLLDGSARHRALLIDADRQVISDSKRRLPILTVLPPGASLAREACTPEGRYLVDPQGDEVRALCRELRIATQTWRVWLTTPRLLITAAATEARWLALQTSALVLLPALALLALLSARLGGVSRLVVEGATRLARGDFGVELPRVSRLTPREMAHMITVLGEMVARLRESDGRVRSLIRSLEEVNAQLEPLADAWRQVSEAVEILSPEGETLFVNPAFEELVRPAAPPVGAPTLLLSLPCPTAPERSVGEVLLGEARAGRGWAGEVEVWRDERRQSHSLQSSPIVDEAGALTRVVVVRHNTTDERLAQAAAAHNDRLAAVGTLAAGVAHEVNNPLMYIRVNLELLEEALAGGGVDAGAAESLLESTRDAIGGVDRVSQIVKSLLSIARSGGERGRQEAMGRVDLGELARVCASLVRSEFSKRVSLEVEVPEGVFVVWGRRSELLQVLLNLLMNAAQAMPTGRVSGNRVAISCRRVEGGRAASGRAEGAQVVLCVEDNASGIPEADLPRIFEPFFSSKPVGEGTGLGLAVSRGIVQAHGGEVRVRSRVGVGTTFEVLLPAEEGAAEAGAAEEGAAEASAGELSPQVTPIYVDGQRSLHLLALPSDRRRVLVVDDEPLVAKSVARLLRGDAVLVASNGVEALRALRALEVDVVLSDVMMPELDGPGLFRALEAEGSPLCERFFFMTGAAKGALAEALARTGRPTLSKPISRQALLEALGGVGRREGGA